MAMDWSTANALASDLWREFISLRPAVGLNGYLRHSTMPDDYRYYDLETIRASMLSELRATRKNPSRMTTAALRELRGKLILLGKIRATLTT